MTFRVHRRLAADRQRRVPYSLVSTEQTLISDLRAGGRETRPGSNKYFWSQGRRPSGWRGKSRCPGSEERKVPGVFIDTEGSFEKRRKGSLQERGGRSKVPCLARRTVILRLVGRIVRVEFGVAPPSQVSFDTVSRASESPSGSLSTVVQTLSLRIFRLAQSLPHLNRAPRALVACSRACLLGPTSRARSPRARD